MTPRYALYHGKRVRVLNYVQTNLWRVLDRSDTVRLVSSAHLTFLPGRKDSTNVD